MSFNWSDFLALADALNRSPNSPGPIEASLRSAVSRAYYAAYCSTRNFADTRGEIALSGKPSDHQLVISHFRSSTDSVRKRIGNDLRRLRHRRNMADYDDNFAGRLQPLAQSSVAIAQNILNALSGL